MPLAQTDAKPKRSHSSKQSKAAATADRGQRTRRDRCPLSGRLRARRIVHNACELLLNVLMETAHEPESLWSAPLSEKKIKPEYALAIEPQSRVARSSSTSGIGANLGTSKPTQFGAVSLWRRSARPQVRPPVAGPGVGPRKATLYLRTFSADVPHVCAFRLRRETSVYLGDRTYLTSLRSPEIEAWRSRNTDSLRGELAHICRRPSRSQCSAAGLGL